MASVDVGTLSGQVEFEDHASSTLDLLLHKVTELEDRFGGMGRRVVESAGGFIAAEAVISAFKETLKLGIDVIKDMTIEGAAIADVEDNFAHLNEQAGRLSSTLLGALKDGTHNTVDEFTLIKMASSDLTANMNLTDKQFRTLADGAFALAQSKGEDVANVMEILNEAMLKGNARTLALYTGKVDLTAAEDKLAASMNTTADKLTAEGKLQADRTAILDAVTAATGRLGVQTDGLDELLAQAHAAWTNFYNDIAKTVATSPSVIHAYEAIRDALVDAFGGDASSMAETFVSWINSIADAAGHYIPIVVKALVDVKDWVINVYDAVISSWDALPDWMKTVAERSALTVAGIYLLDHTVGAATSTITNFINSAGSTVTALSGFPMAIANITNGLASLKLMAGLTTLEFTSMAGAKASLALLGESAVALLGPLGLAAAYAVALYAAFELGKWQPVSDFFMNLGLIFEGYTSEERAAMIASDNMTKAQGAQTTASTVQHKAAAELKGMMEEINAVMPKATAGTDANAKATEHAGLVMEQTTAEAQKFRDALAEMDSVGSGFQKTLEGIDGETVDAIKYYLEAGVAQDKLATAYDLTSAQIGAVAAALKDEVANFKLEEKQIEDSTNRWADYYKMEVELSGTATEQTIADVESWKAAQITAHEAAKTDTADFYDWLGKTEQLMYEKSDKARLEADVHSKAHFEKIAADAREAYNFALAHADQFSAGFIADLGHTATAAEAAAAGWRTNLGGAIDAVTDKVRTLSGEMITLAEQAARQHAGGTTNVTSQNFEQVINSLATNGGWSSGAATGIDTGEAYQLAKKGYSLQEIIDIFRNRKNGASGPIPPPQGPRIPGFKDGGIGDFGAGTLAMLHGPEAIIPLDNMNNGLGGTMNLTFNVNGTAVESARQIKDIIMGELKQVRKFGSS